MTGSEIRRAFLDYFAARGHARVPSASLIPAGDPTLLFTNAGMNQFKEVFTGAESRPYKRATSSQRCVRAGGKHNDLESVGRTARHHTFFEMLGNFSFGDYFKEEAVAFAWEFLTKELGIDPARLAFTVFAGEGDLPPDDFTRAHWPKATGLPEDRVCALGMKDNFWMMGETGPCGPCSEVHYHQGDDLPCEEERAGRRCRGVACECDRWIELWNLVFMEFERKENGELVPLPAPSIDTGMGLERLTAVLQGKRSNFETDLLRPLIDEAAERLGRPYGRNEEDDVALRVLADHARASAYLVADGLVPSNEGRGYVLRRILRRGVKYARHLGAEGPVLAEILPRVFEILDEAHPVSEEKRRAAKEIVAREEENFLATIERGYALLEEELQKAGGRRLPGEAAFRLYDTYGFPVDLTALICRERRIAFDEAGFEREMEKQRTRSKAASKFEAERDFAKGLPEDVPPTVFVGYEMDECEAEVLAVLPEGGLVLDRTPFYAESGGQVADTGRIEGEGFVFEVEDVRKTPGGVWTHVGRTTRGEVSPGARVRAVIDAERRRKIERHHTATHLLHAALREVLGTHVGQAGSYVGPDRLRFDFTHPRPVSPEEIEAIERRVNEAVLAAERVTWEEKPKEEALRSGAMAFFGDKYGDVVRVVSVGAQGAHSMELCGGTHVRETGRIGFFRVLSESSVASGIRRIEAASGSAAVDTALRDLSALSRLARRFSVPPGEVEARVLKLAEELEARGKELTRLKSAAAKEEVARLVREPKEAGGVRYVAARLDGVDDAALREASREAIRNLGSGVVLLAGAAPGKARLVVQVSKDLAKRLPAGRIIRTVAEKVGGKGGGREDFAMAGGSDPDGIEAALAALPEVLSSSASSVG